MLELSKACLPWPLNFKLLQPVTLVMGNLCTKFEFSTTFISWVRRHVWDWRIDRVDQQTDRMQCWVRCLMKATNCSNTFYQMCRLVLNFRFKLFALTVVQDVTEDERRTECEKKQAQILQYVFGSMLFILHFQIFFSVSWCIDIWIASYVGCYVFQLFSGNKSYQICWWKRIIWRQLLLPFHWNSLYEC